MISKGLPAKYKPFTTVKTQKKNPDDLVAFKSTPHSYKETMRGCDEETSDYVMTISKGQRKYIKMLQMWTA